MKILVATDKFKGSLSSLEAGNAVKSGLEKRWPGSHISVYPIADGGDGFDEVMAYYFSLEKRSSAATDPLGRPITAGWSWDAERKIAFISVASASGLALLAESERNAGLTSSYGTGMLVAEAIGLGAKEIVLGLGGSATNDAGMGLLTALGFQLFDELNQPVQPVGSQLARIYKIVPAPHVPDVVFNIASDVTNPLYGENGAAYVYATQKGATARQLEQLDAGLRSVAAILENDFDAHIGQRTGMGAAGGIAAGLAAFFNVTIKPGIDLVLEASDFQQQLAGAHLVITGEGRLDDQSTQGKVVGRLAEICSQQGIKCVAVCGRNELTSEQLKAAGIQQVLEIRTLADTTEDAMENAALYLERLASSILI